MNTVTRRIFPIGLSALLLGAFACDREKEEQPEMQPKTVEDPELTTPTAEPEVPATGSGTEPRVPPADPTAGQQPMQLDSQTQQLLTKVHQTNEAEVEMAKLAKDKQVSGEVEELATKLEEEHKSSNEKLQQLTQEMGVELQPTAQPPEQVQQAMQKLEQASGKQFEREFVTTQIQIHEQTLQELRSAEPNIQNPEVRQYVQETISHMEDHLKQAQQIQ